MQLSSVLCYENKITDDVMGGQDDIVLNFYDSLLRQSDIELLEGNRWLNDKLIGFSFEYFEKVLFEDISQKLLYINPDVSQFIKFAPDDEVGIFLEPLELLSKHRIFFAVNDNTDVDSVGGSHWSLLMFDREDNTFHHYDSFHSGNVAAARIVANKAASYLKASVSPIGFVEEKSAQQTNAYPSNPNARLSSYSSVLPGCDCGVYVICNSEALSRQYSAGDMTPVCDGVTQSMVTQKRHDLKELILRLAADKASDDKSSDDNTSYDKTSSFPSPDTADLIPEEDLI